MNNLTIRLDSASPMEGGILSGDFIKDLEKNEKSKLFKLSPSNENIVIPTMYTQYIIAGQAKKAFANLICSLDSKMVFHRENIKEIIDPNEFKEKLIAHQDQKNSYDKMVKNFKESHNEWFDTIFSVPNVAVYAADFKYKGCKNAEEAEQGYKYASAILKKIGKEEISTQPKIVISEKFKEEYEKVCKEFSNKCEWEGAASLKLLCKNTVKETKTRLALTRKPYINTKPAEEYTTEFLEYLVLNDFNKTI